MKGITFGLYHSYADLNLILKSKEIGSPAVKQRKQDIEGANSALDYTDYFGEPKYEDVTHKFQFSTTVPENEFLSLYSEVKNALHGKKMRIVLDDDPLFYYIGRPNVSPFTSEKNIGLINIEPECEPFKYKKDLTVKSQAVNGTANIVLQNSRMRTVPTITTTAAMTISFADWTLTTSAGTFTIPELELTEGANTVTVTGTGNITFTYQEGSL